MAASHATARMSAEAPSHDGLNGNDGSKSHIRTYQACIPCRKRKVRCDLGPVDAPHDPPCVRCRRESKDCFFSATRRKRKNADGEDEYEDEIDDEYTKNNGRKRARGSTGEGEITPVKSNFPGTGNNSAQATSGPLTPGGHIGNSRPLRPGSKSGNQSFKIEDEESERVSNETAGYLQRGEIFGGHDALNLLATASAGLHHRTASMSSNRPSFSTTNTPGSIGSLASPQASGNFPSLARALTQDHTLLPTSQPSTSAQTNGAMDPTLEAARQFWSKVRFVNSGWFTADEGMQYIEYFYVHIAPLTPVTPPNFRDVSKHEALFKTEPMLAITMLTVASRYMKLSGPGANSRPYAIHSKLWNFLQRLIDRIIWGQEQFIGGFSSVGSLPGSDVNPLHRKGLRTLGTVESLMILTEWHPRALHFPPSDDGDDLLISDEPGKANATLNGLHRIDSWLEPCWRSDRMCWMLLNSAYSLAIEIGVFDEKNLNTFSQENKNVSPSEVKKYYVRKDHLRDLLQVYITQTSGRLGLTAMLPKSYMADAFPEAYQVDERERFHQRMNKFATFSRDNLQNEPISEQLAALNANPQEMTLHFWVDLASIMHLGNQRMFPNRTVTRDLIRKGEYTNLLKTFEPKLRAWREKFDACESIPHHMRAILNIEFEYARVYLHCLALQAVIERCTHNSPPMAHVHTLNGTGSPDNGAIRPEVVAKWIGNDRQYIEVIIDACRNVLKVVNDDLFPTDFLKHVPVRTYFRIISVIIILLKTFALGNFEKDVELSLGLIDTAVHCLGTSVVDDVHVINSFTELAEILTTRIRARLVRLASSGNSKSRGVTPTPQHSANMRTLPPPMGPPDKTMKTRATVQNSTAVQWNAAFGVSNNNNNNNNETYQYIAPLNNNPHALSYNGRPSNPLYGISTESYDPGTNNVSIVPPPTFGTNGTYNAQLGNGSYGYANYGQDGANDNSDWLTLPLDSLFTTHHGGDVTGTTFGPDVGGMDLLDVLLDPNHGPVSYH